MFREGRYAEVEDLARRITDRFPQKGFAWKALGAALSSRGRVLESLEAMQRAIELSPNDAQTHSNLGQTLRHLGRLEKAEQACRTAIRLKPDFAEAYSNLGIVLRDLGKPEQAEEAHRAAIRFKPNFAEAHSNLGNALKDQGLLEQALQAYRRAIGIRPEYLEAHSNLGLALHECMRLTEAERAHRAVIGMKPDCAEAHANLGNVLQDLGRLPQAEQAFRTAIRLKPDYVAAYSNLLFAISYQGWTSPLVLREEARRYGRIVSGQIKEKFSAWCCHPRPKRLRVGLVSGDLRSHPVGFFLESTLSRLDSERIELFAYATRNAADELTDRIEPHFTQWKSLVGLNDEQAARLIHADGVHLLLDLSGHTAHNRLSLFGWKPAPVQATWLGYWATTGISEIDFLLADAIGVPFGQEAQFVEEVWRLPNTRICFSPIEEAPQVSRLPVQNGVSEGVTFGCFQVLPKVNDRTLTLWARVFSALPSARLHWQCKQFDDPGVRAGTVERLSRFGISPARVCLRGKVSRTEYLAAYAEVDLVLDTFPFPGGTTTCDALWMGVPTLTLAGDAMLARQGASLLTAAGLSEWIAETEDEFVAKALNFTGSPEALTRLARLRSTLREKVAVSPLFDAERFARNLETAWWGMWERRQGERVQLT